jgi:hypothetical protein
MNEIPISEDYERASLKNIKLQYIEPAVGWAGLWEFRDRKIEIRIGGDAAAPDPSLVELAELVLPKLEAIESASDEYIRGFVGDGDGFYQGFWRLRSLRLRWDPGDQRLPGSEFEVKLSVGQDDYGEWSVRFVYFTFPERKLWPYLFSRRQW